MVGIMISPSSGRAVPFRLIYEAINKTVAVRVIESSPYKYRKAEGFDTISMSLEGLPRGMYSVTVRGASGSVAARSLPL